jgi:hypothetical protein
MKRILSVKEKTAYRNKGSLKSAYRRGFSRGLALGLILLAAFIVLTGGLLYGQGGVDALFIDEKGTVKVQELEVKGATRLGDAVTVEGATTLKKNLTVNGNAGIGTTAPKAALDIQQEERTDLEKHPKSVKGLYVTGNFAADKGVEFRHNNASQGIGFGFNTIYATGSHTDQNLNLKPRGSGKVNVSGDFGVTGNVGIGTADPEEKLHVNGNVLASKVYSENAREEKVFHNGIQENSRIYVDMPGMSVSVTTGNRHLFIHFVVSESWTNGHGYYKLLLDNEEIGNARNHYVSRHSSVMILRMVKVPEGPHNIKVQWKVDSGQIQSLSTRTLAVIEM